MGLVQKIFYFHVAVVDGDVRAAIAVCGIASAIYLFKGTPAADRVAVAAAELAVLFGADRARHRAAVGAQGVGRLVAVGRAADDGASCSS